MSNRAKKLVLTPIREPSGRLSRATSDDIEAVAPAIARRLRDAAARGMADAEWGTELGRLFLEGRIKPGEYEAGKRWGRLVKRWQRVIGAPKPYAGEGPIAFLGTVRARDAGDDPPVESEEGKRLLKERRQVMREMQEAHAALIGGGMLAEAAVRRVCEENEIVAGDFNDLWRGLQWLAQHWGLTTTGG